MGGANFFNQIFNNQATNRVRMEAMRLKQYYKNNAEQLHYILNQDPELANPIVADDDQKLIEVVGKRLKSQMDAKRKEMERINRLMNADPNDIEAQREIEEHIRKGLVDENY